MASEPLFQPGDVANGYVLGSDGKWWPVAAPGVLQPPLHLQGAPDYRRPGRALVIVSSVVVALAFVAVVVGVLLLGLFAAVEGESLQSGVPIEDLDVGDCFTESGDLDGGMAGNVVVVQCNQAHEAEVVLVDEGFFAGSDDLPTSDQAAAAVASACRAAVESYTGASDEDSDFGFSSALPSRDSWAMGDRTLICAGVAMSGEALQRSIRAG